MVWVFTGEGLWGTGYAGLMGYGMQVPAYQSRGLNLLWGMRGYGLPSTMGYEEFYCTINSPSP
jgi:hypothetical protein